MQISNCAPEQVCIHCKLILEGHRNCFSIRGFHLSITSSEDDAILRLCSQSIWTKWMLRIVTLINQTLVVHGKVNVLIFSVNSCFIFYSCFFYILESLYGCFDDMGTCCYGCWCHPCLFGSNAEQIDGSSCVGMCLLYCLLSPISLCCIPHMIKRTIMRQKYHLQEEPCNDCVVSTFCAGCSVCQEARELKARGIHSTHFNTISSVSLCMQFQLNLKVVLMACPSVFNHKWFFRNEKH